MNVKNKEMSEAIVKVENLYHRYTTQWAVQDLSFEIRNRGVLGLLGANGAGKSTTMNIMCGVLNQTSGNIYINGINLREHPIEAKKYIGFLPQKPPLNPDMTVDEYLHFCAHLRRMDGKEVHQAVEAAKERCGIAHFRKRLLKNLSGGYQQRVGIAQAIIHNPKVVVFDEPTNGLDPIQIVEIRNLIKEIAVDRAVIISTHILPEVQLSCENIIMITQGKCVFSGTIEEFDNYIEPNSLVITLDAAPDVNVLASLPSIKRVDKLTEKRYRLFFSDATDIADRVGCASVEGGWKLTEINLERGSLDEVFAQLSGKSRIGKKELV